MKISVTALSEAISSAIKERAIVNEAVMGRSPMQVMQSANNEIEDMLVQLRHVIDDLSDKPNGGGLAFTSLEEMIEHLEAAQRSYAGARERTKRTVPDAKHRGHSSLWSPAKAASKSASARRAR